MKLINFFQDGAGNLSATRLAFLFWSLGVLLVWIYLSISGHEMAKIDVSVTTIIAILMTGKVAQSFSPGESAPTSPDGSNATVSR